MSDPPPSSTQPAVDPPFFHHPDGTRIQIFVEAGGILNRPRLIRNLKKHDAVICSDPKNAQIILVNAESWQGKEFIREWGKDQNKVVLSYAWVTKCISVGKPLLVADNWGDCLTRDDGLPIVKPVANGEGGEVATKSPLPTPRETPIEAGPASALPKKFKMSDLPAKRRSTDRTLPQIETMPVSPAIPPTMQPQPQSQTQPQSTPIHSPSATDSMSVFTQQQQTMPFTMPNGAMAPFNMGMNMMSFPPQMLAMFAQQQAAASSPIPAQPPTMMPQMSENFTTALMDIMYRGMPGGMPMSQWPMMGMMPPQMQQQLAQSTAGSSGSGTAVRDGSSAPSGSRRDTESPSLSLSAPAPHSPSVLQASIKRKRKSDALEYDSIDELPGTEEDDDGDDGPPLAALAKKKKKSEQKQKHRTEREERKGRRSSLPYTAPARKPYESQSQTPKPSSSTVVSSGKLFVGSDEKAMQFFVQVDLKDRLEVTRAIKKNGGALTSEIATADYAVLYSRSTTFKELLHNATATRTPAVSFHFVLDAVEHGSIPDNLNDYLFNVKQNLKKKKRASNNAAEAEAKRLDKNAKQAERAAKETAMKYIYVARSGAPEELPPPASAPPPPTTVRKGTSATPKPVRTSDPASSKGKEKEKDKEKERAGVPPRASTPTPTVKKPTPAAISASASASTSSPAATKVKKRQSGYYPKDRSPTPPTRIERVSQGFLYTAEEKEWVEKYLFVLFKRDPNMGQTTVSKALNRKLKHHSVGSISTFLTMNFRSQYEEARKRGGIAHRKEKSWWEEEQQRKEKLEQGREQQQQQGQQKVKEREQEQQKAQGNEEDHVMEDANDVKKDVEMSEEKDGTLPTPSPMEVDGPPKEAEAPQSTADVISEKQVEKPLTPLEEEDIQNIVQFFLDGGDSGEEPEEQVWAKLEQKAKCKSAADWDEFYSRHHSEVVARYTTRLDEKGP
ncbi:hypothetical protein P691DRAFT_716285 [Macrolepiota fuliginosa MF-IS2]|uniref:BRCT domain-containing protein n=1 Tax=Macrolepiota fuliginosa MF-IS2 TaxID=1400762 RepID=A0A9P5XR82_9AGAR|nr:hypothetical protein P691DRAFT_716285 [Macrolepiota fuliginosa MF-IS2]